MSVRIARLALVLLLLVCQQVPPTPFRRTVLPATASSVIRLQSTSSIWLADTTPEERNSSAGLAATFKLKSIQEMAAIRFDARPAKGLLVRSARLFLHTTGRNMLRYLRVSTVNQDWVAGESRRAYGPADGATYLWAEAGSRRPWSYPGSEFADVIMGMGHSITTYAQYRQEPGGWISVPLTPELIYALAAGNTDGLAVMDGGQPCLLQQFHRRRLRGKQGAVHRTGSRRGADRDPGSTTRRGRTVTGARSPRQRRDQDHNSIRP